MISQFLIQAKLSSGLELGGGVSSETSEGRTAPAGERFSLLLTGLSGQAALPPTSGALSEREPATGDVANGAERTGKAANALAATGKILPLLAASFANPANAESPLSPANVSPEPTSNSDNGGPGEDNGDEQSASAGTSDTAVAPSAPAAAAAILSAAAATTFPRDAAPAAGGETRSAAAPARPHAVAPSLPHPPAQDTAQASSTLLTASGESPSAPPFALHVAPAAASVSANVSDDAAPRDSSSEQRGPTEVAAKAPGKPAPETASAPFTPASIPGASAGASPMAAPPAVIGPEQPLDGPQPSAAEGASIERQITRELSRIVDNLASAREALVARSATLALEHGDFGELSLRFDQRGDGQLSVRLSASDPDAHRAIAAAVAERPMFAQSEAGNGQSQSQSQRPAYSQAQLSSDAGARGGSAEREDGAAGQSSARHDRNDAQRGRPAADGATHSKVGNSRSGIFA
jgi:hypothetical protein